MFKAEAAEAALDRLGTLDPKKLKPILRLIMLCGDPADPRLHPLLDAPDPDIRMETIRMLLQAGSPAPIPLISGMIRSKDLTTSVRAIKLAGEHRVSALADALAGQLRRRYITDAAAFRNRFILESLNKIGSDSALPKLRRLAGTRLSLTPGLLRATKAVLADNLSGYPDHASKWLLEIGIKTGKERRHDDK